MNCSGFEERFERFREGKLTPEDCRAVEEHLLACAYCRELMEIASEGLSFPALDPPQDLTPSILERTSGPACRRAHEHLCDYVDGKLEAGYGEILALHVAHCGDCSKLAASLAELNETLPQMSELEPGVHFTFRVLRATSRLLPEVRLSPGLRLQRWWLRLIQRPRFSWEAAYLATVLMVCVLGNPLTVFRDLSLRAGEIFQSKSPFSWVSVALPGSLVRNESGVMKSTREFVGVISSQQQELAKSAAFLFQQGTQSLQAAARSDFQLTRAFPRKALSALQRAWTALFPKKAGIRQ
jgi:hypothetical protein